MKERGILIKDDKKKAMIRAIKKYFAEERKEELGDLAALLILDFFMDKLGPEIYNQGLQDAHAYMSEKLEDLYGLSK